MPIAGYRSDSPLLIVIAQVDSTRDEPSGDFHYRKKAVDLIPKAVRVRRAF
jgi:hypothetical protein